MRPLVWIEIDPWIAHSIEQAGCSLGVPDIKECAGLSARGLTDESITEGFGCWFPEIISQAESLQPFSNNMRGDSVELSEFRLGQEFIRHLPPLGDGPCWIVACLRNTPGCERCRRR